MLTTTRVGVPRYVTEMPVQVSERRTRNWTQPCWLTWDRVPYSKNNTIKQENAGCSLFAFGRIDFSIPDCSTGRKYTKTFRGASRPIVLSGHGHFRPHPSEFIPYSHEQKWLKALHNLLEPQLQEIWDKPGMQHTWERWVTDAPMLLPTNGEVWIGWTHYTHKKNLHCRVVE